MLRIIFIIQIFIIKSYMAVIPLYVAGLLEQTDYWWSKYANFLPSLFESTAEEISNRTDILNGYELKFIYADTQGKDGLAGKVLNEILSTPPTKIAVFGPQMSHEIKIVGMITPFYNTVQMNYVAKTSSTKDRNLYSTLYSTSYIEDDLNPLRIALMKYFKWNRVATLVYNEDLFTSQIDELHQILSNVENNLTLLTSGIITDKKTVTDHIIRLKQYDSRIIIGAFRSTKAGEVFCEVYKQGLFGRRYTWILTGGSIYENWIRDADVSKLSCSRENLYEAANYMITLNQIPLSSNNHTTISGRTPEEYDLWMNDLHAKQNAPYILTRNHPWIYDAVWALALGLNNSIRYLNGSKLEDFDYTRTDIKQSILKGMDEVRFEGVSGQVSFNHGRRLGPAYIQLNNGDARIDVGEFDPVVGTITWFIDPSSLWPGNRIPKDGSKSITETVKSSKLALVFIGILTSIGFIGAIGILIFNITFRKNRHIKMSSPRINNMIICGGMIMYISVYISILEYISLVENGSICMLGIWATALGFTTSFGALFSKTWRVHVLFHNNSLKKRIIKDLQLFAVCAVLLAIDVTMLLPWTVFYSLDKKKIIVIIEDEENDITHHEVHRICTNETKIYWQGAQYIYKGLLLAFGTFLAWETRNIEVPALNDSKLIGFCVYNIVIICFVGVPIHHILREDQITARFVLRNCFVIFCTTLALCILFIPKLKLRNETDNINFVKSLNGRMTSTAQPSVSKPSRAALSGTDINFGESKTLHNGNRRELNGHSSNRPITPNNTTKETVMNEQSTAV